MWGPRKLQPFTSLDQINAPVRLTVLVVSGDAESRLLAQSPLGLKCLLYVRDSNGS